MEPHGWIVHLVYMPASSVPSTVPRWPLLAPLFSGAIFSLLATVWAPWERIHPTDATLREAIGYAPLWSHRFEAIPGAHVDWTGFIINIAVIWVICIAGALMLSMSVQHD